MSFQRVEIVTGVEGGKGYFDATRLRDGRLYVVLYDNTASPKVGLGYISSDEGATWSAETWSTDIGSRGTNAGGDQPIVLSDPFNSVWVVTSNFDAGNELYALRREEWRTLWGDPQVAFSGAARLTDLTSVTELDAAMDSSVVTAGIHNIGATFIHSGKTYYADNYGGSASEDEIDGTAGCTTPHIAITGGSTKNIAWTQANKAWGAQKIAHGSWSSRTQISTGGHNVLSVEDCVIQPNTQPAIIYREDSATTKRLYLAEYDSTIPGWTVSRVQDGTDDYDFFAGCALHYDSRGSVYVTAMYDHAGSGTAEVYSFELLRALNSTTWNTYARTANSGGDALQCRALTRVTPDAFGHQPCRPYQGAAYFAFEWPNGVASTAQELVWYNQDTYTQAAGIYPTIFSTRGGEAPYRSGDTTTRSSITLSGEGTAVETFPSIAPDFPLTEALEFFTDSGPVRAGYSVRMSRFPSGRRTFSLGWSNLKNADKITIKTFVDARKDDLAPFDWAHPEDPDTPIAVRIPDQNIAWRMVGRGDTDDGPLWAFEFQMQEVL